MIDRNEGFISRVSRLFRHVWRGWAMLELGPDPYLMRDLTSAYIRRYDSDDDLYFALLCHSKSVSDDSLRSLHQYHGWLRKEFGSRVQAITFRQAAEQLAL
ncbi:MAG: hypothetical protein GF341_10080 [candidate division Zixibacteria bacterium]|nr:hypothetical protein [candidate division Zixibacteria bacterium]